MIEFQPLMGSVSLTNSFLMASKQLKAHVSTSGFLLLTMGKMVVCIDKHQWDQSLHLKDQQVVSLPAHSNPNWKSIQVRLGETSRSIFVCEKTYQRVQDKIEAEPFFEELETLYAQITNYPIQQSYNIAAWADLEERLNQNKRIGERKEISRLVFKIKDKLQQYRIFDLGFSTGDNIGIGFTNGICNRFDHALTATRYISKLSGGFNVFTAYNPTHGFIKDLIVCVRGFLYQKLAAVDLLHNMWNQFFEKSCLDAKFLMVCHSQGAIHVRNALAEYSPELRKRIIVVAIAPGAYIDPKHCFRVYHYRVNGWKDIVPLIDQEGLKRTEKTVRVLPSDSQGFFSDHFVGSPSYRPVLMRKLDQYVQTNQLPSSL